MVGAGEVPDVALRSLSRLTNLRTFECNSILRFTGAHKTVRHVRHASWPLRGR